MHRDIDVPMHILYVILCNGLPSKIPPSIIIQAYIREYFAVVKSFIFDR